MGLILEEDRKRYFNQLALEGVKESFSEEIGFVHQGVKIPLLENFYAVIALCGSRQKESVEKAKTLLSNLLSFQIKSGRFPCYLHQYPSTKMDVEQLDFYLTLDHLIKEHGFCLGKILLKKVKASAKRLYKDILTHLILPNSSRFFFKSAVVKALFEQKEFDQEIYTPKLTSERLGELLLLYKKIRSDENLLLEYSKFWHLNLGNYVGPLLEEYYYKKESKRTTFDYFMEDFYQKYSEKTQLDSQLKLKGIFVKSSQIKEDSLPQDFDGVTQEGNYALSSLENSSLFFFKSFKKEENSLPCGFHLLRWLWKDQDALYNFCSQNTNCTFDATFEKNTLDCLFTYNEEVSDETHEIDFFLFREKNLNYFINGKKGMVFFSKDLLTLESPNHSLEFVFEQQGEKTQVIGQISYGNRPAQLYPKASKSLEAFDVKITLKTLRKSPGSQLKVRLRLTPKEPSLEQTLVNLMKHPLHVDHYQHTDSHQ